MTGIGVDDVLCRARARVLDSAKNERRGRRIVREIETQVEESTSNQILFPMAVGVLFLAVLVVGAFLG